MTKEYTHDQFNAATKADLYDFLMRYHSDDYSKEGQWLRAKYNRSVNIKKGFYGFIDFSGSGSYSSGNGITLLTVYHGYTLAEAILALSGQGSASTSHDNACAYESAPVIDISPAFPQKDNGYASVLHAYLTKSRGISNDTVDLLERMNLVYQFQFRGHKNILFINSEKNWGEVHGTNTYKESRCKKRDNCPFNKYKLDPEDKYGNLCIHMSQCPKYKKDSYHIMISDSASTGYWCMSTNPQAKEKIYICEGSIDAISLYELHRLAGIYDGATYAAIGGTNKQPAIDRIISLYDEPILAVDNDDAGEWCRNRNANLKYIIPRKVDWNDDLQDIRKS